MGLGLCYRSDRLPCTIPPRWATLYVLDVYHISSTTVTGQLWSLATTQVQVSFRIQLNSILFAKTLVRKNIAAASPPKTGTGTDEEPDKKTGEGDIDEEDEFSSKAQVMTLMTTDVDRVSDFAWHLFSLIGEFRDTWKCLSSRKDSRCADRDHYRIHVLV